MGPAAGDDALTTLDLVRFLAAAFQSAATRPNAGVALSNLLDLAACQVEWCEEAESARIARSSRGYVIQVSPTFAQTYLTAGSDWHGESVEFLIAHELAHRHLDFLRTQPRDPRRRLLAGVVADQIVNHGLVRTWFGGQCPQLLIRTYAEASLPARLLLPPGPLIGWEGPEAVPDLAPEELEARVAAAFEPLCQNAAEFARYYVTTWTRIQHYSHAALVDWLSGLLGSDFPSPFLLGDHRSGGTATPPRLQGPGRGLDGLPGGGYGAGTDLLRQQVRAIHTRAPQFMQALRRALAVSPGVSHQSSLLDIVPGNPDRRTVARLAAGQLVLRFPQRRPDSPTRARLYVDVSGSVNSFLGVAAGLAAAARSLIAPTIHQFSTSVEDVSLLEAAQGVVRTTHGTDLAAPLEHALARGYSRILLLTDGVGAPLRPSLISRVEGHLEIHLVLVHPRFRESTPLAQVARRIWTLPAGLQA